MAKSRRLLFICAAIIFVIMYFGFSRLSSDKLKSINTLKLIPDPAHVSKKKIKLLNRDELPWWERGDCRLDEPDNYRVLVGKFKVLADHLKFAKDVIPVVENIHKRIHEKQYTNNNSDAEPLYAYDKWKRTTAVGHTCGWRSWWSGKSQKVVSYSIFGKNPEYWNELGHLLTRLDEAYPGWGVRVYTNPRGLKHILCPLLSSHSNLHICDVVSLPPPLSDISPVHPMLWRSTPLQDILVNVVIVRDTDAMVLDREVAAVNEWLESGKTLHVMRDHPHHLTHILGGMWGVNITHKNRELITRISNSMLKAGFGKNTHGDDQAILSKIAWPQLRLDMMSHDSYLCCTYRESKPWPTQRKNGKFVGNADYKIKHRNSYLKKKCPSQCRPKDHQDWIYC